MRRVAVVQRSLPHYRYPAMAQLAKDPRLSVTCIVTRVGRGVPGERDRTVRILERPGVDFNFRWGAKTYQVPFSWSLCREALSGRYDTLILEGSTNLLMNVIIVPVGRLKGLKIHMWDAGRRRNARVTLLRRMADPIFAMLLRMSDGVIAYSTLAKEFLEAKTHGKVPVVVAQNAVASQPPARDGLHERPEFNIPGNGPIVLYVGALERRKKIDNLVRAVEEATALIPEVRLVIVGGGPDESRLRDVAREMSNVIFLGEILDGVESVYRQANVYVLPSEGGLGLNQAMACGLPVIATSADGTEMDLIRDDDTGYLVDEDDTSALAEAIVRVLRDPAKARMMGERGRVLVTQEITVDNMVARIAGFICAEGRGTRS